MERVSDLTRRKEEDLRTDWLSWAKRQKRFCLVKTTLGCIVTISLLLLSACLVLTGKTESDMLQHWDYHGRVVFGV